MDCGEISDVVCRLLGAFGVLTERWRSRIEKLASLMFSPASCNDETKGWT